MKLISYTVNNNKFILLENIVIKIVKNKCNIYSNDTLYYSYNKEYFLKFIEENYNKYYDKINDLLSDKKKIYIKGGSSEETLPSTPVNNNETAQDDKTNENKEEKKPEEEKKSDEKKEEEDKNANNAGVQLNLLIDNPNNSYYFFIFQILLILSKIIPNDINVDTYVNNIYNEITKTNPNLVFTEQYLLKKLNKKIRENTKNICKSEEAEKILRKYIPNPDTTPGNDINNIIENSLLLEKIKRNIDNNDVKNENEVHFQYKFNIKQEGILWDGNIEEFLDKIFNSSEMKKNLDEFDNIIKFNLNKDIKKDSGDLKLEEGGIFSSGSSWDIKYNINSEGLDNYIVKTKYNTFEKIFEVIIKFDKKEFDTFLNRGANKLETDEENNKLISNYMENLHIPILEILNKEIKERMKKYVDLDNTNNENYKKDIAQKILDMIFRHISTNNLSMFNFIDLESTTIQLLKNFTEEKNYYTELFEKEDMNSINDLLTIKFSKCSDIDISQCNKKTVNSVCELVKYRDIKKLPKNFLEDFEYKRKLETEDKNSKVATLGLILKNITEKIYMKTKELKLKLSNVFIDSISKNIKKHLKTTLYSFKFDMIYSVDYLNKQIADIKIKIDELSEILNNDEITLSDLSKIDKNLEEFKIIINQPDTSWASWNPFSSGFSEEQLTLKKTYLNTILRYTIKLNHVDIFKQNLMWTLHSKLLIYHLFKFIEKIRSGPTKMGSNILKDIVSKISPKIEKLKLFINDETLNEENFNLTIFDLVNPKKLSKLKLQNNSDSEFINSGFSSENPLDKKYKSLDELEKLIFKKNLSTETNEDFLNNIMFFYKKTNDNNWEIILDINKKKYRDIYINTLTRNIRNYFKNKLETEFNQINNEHTETLEKLGLNIPEEEISEDIELSAQLENELTKLNDTKFELFKKTKDDLDKIIELITIKNDKIEFFEYIINKYVINEKKFPFDFSSEYEKTKTEFNKNLKELLNEFSNMKNPSNNSSIELSTTPDNSNASSSIVEEKETTDISSKAEEDSTDVVLKTAEKTQNATDIVSKTSEETPEKIEEAAVDSPKTSKVEEGTTNIDNVNKEKDVNNSNDVMGELGNMALGAATKIAQEALDSKAKKSNNSNDVMGELGNMALGAATKIAQEAINKKKDGTIYGGESINNDNEQKLENFINKISQNLNENSNPNNINAAISKLQIMYAFQNRDYKTLINKYSKLSDSYYKLIKLEKINKIPITTKPAILTMIDKLFINNLANTNVEEEDEEAKNDDLSKYSNVYNLEDENTVEYKQKKSKKIVKEIEYKLFDGLNLKTNPEENKEKKTSVAFNTSDGSVINY